MMSDSLITAAVVLLVTTGARDDTRTLGPGVSVDCGKLKNGEGEGEDVEVGGYDLAVLLGETEV